MDKDLVNLKKFLIAQGLYKKSKSVDFLIKISQTSQTTNESAGGDLNNLVSSTISDFNSQSPTRDNDMAIEASRELRQVGFGDGDIDYLNLIDLVLDIMGLFPIIGGAADIASFLFAIWRGDAIGIVFGAIGLIPEAGTPVKMSLKKGRTIPSFLVRRFGPTALQNFKIIIDKIHNPVFKQKSKWVLFLIERAIELANQDIDINDDNIQNNSGDAMPDQRLPASTPQWDHEGIPYYIIEDGGVLCLVRKQAPSILGSWTGGPQEYIIWPPEKASALTTGGTADKYEVRAILDSAPVELIQSNNMLKDFARKFFSENYIEEFNEMMRGARPTTNPAMDNMSKYRNTRRKSR